MSDHRPDLYDLIEIEGPPDVPLPHWLTADWMPCPDCRANAFLKWVTTGSAQAWHLTTAHDETCPTLARLEAEPR